jgi:hypothetical protein
MNLHCYFFEVYSHLASLFVAYICLIPIPVQTVYIVAILLMCTFLYKPSFLYMDSAHSKLDHHRTCIFILFKVNEMKLFLLFLHASIAHTSFAVSLIAIYSTMVNSSKCEAKVKNIGQLHSHKKCYGSGSSFQVNSHCLNNLFSLRNSSITTLCENADHRVCRTLYRQINKQNSRATVSFLAPPSTHHPSNYTSLSHPTNINTEPTLPSSLSKSREQRLF